MDGKPPLTAVLVAVLVVAWGIKEGRGQGSVGGRAAGGEKPGAKGLNRDAFCGTHLADAGC